MSVMNLAGVFAPVPTPFDDRDQVDLARLRRACARWVRSPLTGFVVLGSNGEAALLDDDECDRVVGLAREIVPVGRAFIVGTGRESTQAAVRASKRAATLGADAVLVRTPGFFKSQMTHEAFVRHYTAVADVSPVPVLLYNFTAVTGVTLLPAAVSRLAEHPNIIGMKESGGDTTRITELVNGTPEGFSILAGSATTFCDSLSAGAVGGVLALASVVPESFVRLFELTRQARHDEARVLQQQLVPLTRLVTSTYGVAGLKAALNLIGYDVGVPRPPLVPVDESAITELKQALASFEEVVV